MMSTNISNRVRSTRGALLHAKHFRISERRNKARRKPAISTAACAQALENRTLLSSSYSLDNIYSFSFPQGADLESAPILDTGGNLYGTTRGGGNAGGFGTVYEIPKGTTAIKSLASFNKANGANPYGDLAIDSNGNLFGTTWAGGASGVGTVFEIVHGTSAITTFVTFNFTNGAEPQAGLTFDSTGNLFGTTIGGGAVLVQPELEKECWCRRHSVHRAVAF